MRPVDKGTSPYVSIKSYGDALPYLEKSIGCYCSYCEMSINHAPEIEHIFAKNEGGSLTDWNNLLLACKYCNTRKGTIIGKELSDVWIWPDKDNTVLAFLYDDGIPRLNEAYLKAIGEVTFNKASRVFTDLKLDNIPTPKGKDRRWSSRIDAHGKAIISLESWLKAKPTELRQCMKNNIKLLATSTGFFSIWMKVFSDENEIKMMLIDAFLGTDRNCFDVNGNPIPRMGGEL